MRKKLLALIMLAVSVPMLAQTWSKDLEKAAKKGDVASQIAVGNAYFNGDGVDANKAKAAQWYYKATIANSAEAKEKLCSFYSKELEKLAKSGDAEAQFYTGEYYYTGNGVSKNLKKAATWYDLATSQKHSEAKNRLGSFYNDFMVKRAKKEGDAEMQYCLGNCYLNGIEVDVDKETAAVWFEKAMLQGHDKAGEMFFSFESKLKSKRVKQFQLTKIMYCTAYAIETKDGYNIDKSPVAQVNIGVTRNNEYDNHITIKGKKDGDNYSNAILVCETMPVQFNGNIQIKSQNDYQLLITFFKGGELAFKTNNGVTSVKLDDDFSIFVQDGCYGFIIFNNTKGPKFKVGDVCMSMEQFKKTYSLKNKQHLTSLENAVALAGVDSIKCSLIQEFRFNNTTFDFISELSNDTVRIGNNKFYLQGDNYVFIGEDPNNVLVWNDANVCSFTKTFTDGVVSYSVLKKDGDNYTAEGANMVYFLNKEKFIGIYYLDKLSPLGTSVSDVKELWKGEKLKDFPFVMYEGDYTDSKGVSEHWKNGFPGNAAEEGLNRVNRVRKEVSDFQKKKAIERRDAAKKQLLAEGFDPKEVSDLLEKAIVYKDMDCNLIRRASTLNCNVKILGHVKIAGEPRDLVTISDLENGDDFSGFVGYYKPDWPLSNIQKVFIIE